MTRPVLLPQLRDMRKLGFTIIIAAAAAGSSVGQTATPTPPSVDQDPVRISTNLIQLDVTVTDASGKPIADLKPGEIEIYENGRKRQISNLSFISSGTVGRQPSARNLPDQPPPIEPTPLTVSSIRRTIAIVVDDISMSWESVSFTRRALKKFIDEQVREGDLVAILQTGASVGSLQRFTADKRMLHAAVDRIKYNMLGTGGITAFEPLTPSGAQTLSQGLGVNSAAFEAEAEAFLATARSQRQAIFATGTLGALQRIVAGMADLPGRKSLVLFSDGFELQERDRGGILHSGPVSQHVRSLVDQANRGAIVFYPIDPRALQPGGLQAADNTWGMSAKDIREAVDRRRRLVAESRDSLEFLARETGGFATINNNDLNQGLRNVLSDQSYYLVGYEPDSDTFDPASSRFNKIEVKVLRRGAKVRFRSGFFATAENKNIRQAVPDRSRSSVAQLTEAVTSPFAVSEITLRLSSLFGHAGKDGSYVRSLLHINAADLTFREEPDGKTTFSFEVLATSFGSGGQLIDQLGKTYTVSVTPEVYQKAQNEGIVYYFNFPVKKPGAYQYRVAIRDTVSGKLGTASQFLNVPDAASGALTISGIVLEDMSIQDFESWIAGASRTMADPMRDTALRQIRSGRIYRYSFDIYNARPDQQKRPRIETLTRVYREGKLIMDNPAKPFNAAGQTDLSLLRGFGGLSIGSAMEPGDYVLQIIAIDKARPGSERYATQFIQFEVIADPAPVE